MSFPVFLGGGRLWIIFGLSTVFCGCVSTHYDRTEDFQFLWKIGDLDQAGEEAARLAKEGPTRDRLLNYLEQGAVARMQSNPSNSIGALNGAALEYEHWFGPHLHTQTRLSEEFLSTLGSPELKPYKSRIYERVMLRTYQAHNYLLSGDAGRARAEIFKCRQAIADSKDLWAKELEAAREQSKKRDIDLSRTLSSQEGTSDLLTEREKIRALIPPNFPKFVNPASLYLEALYFLHGATQREDFTKAEHSLRQLIAIHPQNQWILEDYQHALSGRGGQQASTYVFFETGRAPVRLERRFDLPLFFFSATSRIPYLGIAFPTLRTNNQFLGNLDVMTQGDQENGVSTELLADMDAIVAQEFDQYFDVELTKAIAGALAKGGLQYLATNSVRSENELTRAVVGAGAGMLAQLTTRADLRSWSTLPKQIRFCKVTTPADQKLTLRGTGMKLSKEVILPSQKVNLVWVRSVSAYTPLRLVGVCSLFRP
jgi:hypothetical protein